MKKTLAFYLHHLHDVGGIETFSKNLVKRLSMHYDITFYASIINNDTYVRLSQYADIKVYENKIKADAVILCSNWSPRNVNIISNKVIQAIHTDYECFPEVVYKKHQSTTHHVAVSENVKRTFELMTPYKIDKVIYNLL